jgi:hypothetical protein
MEFWGLTEPAVLHWSGEQGTAYEDPTLSQARLEILQLRARILAGATLAALELPLRLRPEELNAGFQKALHRLEGSASGFRT